MPLPVKGVYFRVKGIAGFAAAALYAAVLPLGPGLGGGKLAPGGGTVVLTGSAAGRSGPTVLVSRRMGDGWLPPAPALAFAGLAISPFVTADGKRLLFESNWREEAGREDTDLWIADWDGARGSNPRPMGAPFDSVYNEHSPSMSRAGTILFNSTRPGGLGRNDLYLARLIAGRYEAPRSLPAVNSPAQDAGAFLAPDESYLLFWSDRPGGQGKDDLYIAFRSGEGWSAPANLGPEINSAEAETGPHVTSDGKDLVFTRGKDLFRVPFEPARYRQ